MTGCAWKHFWEPIELEKTQAPTSKCLLTRAICKSQKWCSNSWVCSAIGPYTPLTPSWRKNCFDCLQASVTKCSCFHFLGEEISSVFMAGCSYAESWWYADAESWVMQNHDGMPFLNLRKPNPLLPVDMVACLRETTPSFAWIPRTALQHTKVER